ncbi:MAG: VacJ family lipoprotein [Paraperlucidibaca sp.]
MTNVHDMKHILVRSCLLASMFCGHAYADAAATQRLTDYPASPLDALQFVPSDNQIVFERSSLVALAVRDPWEAMNRRVYHFNQRADEYVLLPLARGYRFVTPYYVRTGVHNIFSNLGDVSNLLNSILQLKTKRALSTTGRLLLNTTVGIAGLFDPATAIGLARQDEDFGQTLGFYGVGAGPYLMLPLLGPSNLRDASGRLVDIGAGTQINYINNADIKQDYPALYSLQITDERAYTAYEYGSLNTPFEYEKLRYVFQKSRVLQIQD